NTAMNVLATRAMMTVSTARGRSRPETFADIVFRLLVSHFDRLGRCPPRFGIRVGARTLVAAAREGGKSMSLWARWRVTRTVSERAVRSEDAPDSYQADPVLACSVRGLRHSLA